MSDHETAGAQAIAEELCALDAGVRLLGAYEAMQLLRSLSSAHGLDAESHHWWRTLSNARSFSYGNDVSEWRSRLASLLAELGPNGFYVATTDDEPPPWPVLNVRAGVSLPDIIGEMQYLEYFVFSEDLSRIIFDTHHNVLIASP